MRRFLQCALLAAISFGVAGQDGATGSQHLARGEWRQAKDAFEQALKNSPRDADLHIGLGIALWGGGSQQEAVGSFRRALELNPKAAEAHFNLAIALRGLNDVDGARSHLGSAVALKPEHERARLMLALLLQQAGDTAGAIEHYQYALKANPASADAHNWLGVALLQKNSAAEAIAHFREAVRLKPDYARAWNNLGTTLAQTGEAAAATEAFESGLTHAPADPQLRMNYGIALRNRGEFDAALEQFNAAAKTAGASPDLHLQVGQTLRHKGELQRAAEAFQEAIDGDPEMREGYYSLGATLKQLAAASRPKGSVFSKRPAGPASRLFDQANESLRRGDLTGAGALLEQVIAAAPDNAEAHNLLGFIASRRKDTQTAMAHIRKALSIKPDLAEARYQLGLALWYNGEKQPARDALDHALRSDPALGEAYAFRGMIARESGDLDKARADLQRAVALTPALPSPYIDLGIVFLRLGRVEHAIGQFEAALNLPNRPERLPDLDTAIQEVRTAITRAPKLAELHNVLGRLAGAAGSDPKQVLTAFETAVALKPDFAEAWNNLGLVRVQSQDDAKAIAAFREAIRLRPNFADAYSNLGAVLTASDPAKAVQELEKAQSLDPTSVKVQYNLALAYGASPSQGTAKEIEHLRKAIAVDPGFPRAHFALGRALLRKGDAASAEPALREAIRLEPGYGEAYYQLGLALSRAGRKQEAADFIQKGRDLVAADQKQKLATLDFGEGRAALEAGELDQAVAKFAQVVRAQPDAPEAHHYLGLALARRGDNERAADAFRKTLELDPAHPTARRNLESLSAQPTTQALTTQSTSARTADAQSKPTAAPDPRRIEVELHLRAKAFKEAEASLNRHLGAAPDWAWGWYALGYSAFAQQRIGDSIKALAKSLDLDKTNPEAHNLLGRNLMMIGRFDGAELEFRQAAKLNGNLPEVRYNLGKLYSIQDNWVEARRELEQAVKIKPDYMEAHDALGFALDALGADDAAVASYTEAIRLNEQRQAGFAAPYVNLSALYNRTNDFDKALELAGKALDVNPQSDRAWFQIGRAHERKGQQNEALAALEKAVSLNPRVASYYYVLGTVYRRLGKIEESRQATEKFRALDKESTELESKRREALRSGGGSSQPSGSSARQ